MAEIKKSRRQSASSPGSGDRAKDRAGEHGAEDAEDSCRCKEASQKTFPDLLRLMINDLAFWKKNKKRT